MVSCLPPLHSTSSLARALQQWCWCCSSRRTEVASSELWSGGRREECCSSVDEGTAAMQGWTKVRKSDEDKGQWGPSEPDIDMKAAAFIACYRKKVTESEVHQFPPQLE
ncbi:hypothetical protein K1719_036954 [Acacia pycnantha]|nr:hypothetical protein K1719_036954 [Acacia pycnantha]